MLCYILNIVGQWTDKGLIMQSEYAMNTYTPSLNPNIFLH